MDITGSRKREWGLTAAIYASFIVGVVVNSILEKENTQIILSNLVLSVVLAIVFSVYLHMARERIAGMRPYRLMPAAFFVLAFFVALFLLGIGEQFPVGVFWLLPVVLAAMASGMELAFATHIVLMVEYLILVMPQGQQQIYSFISYLLLGIVASLLFAALKEKKTLVYLAVVLFACDGVLLFVIYQFDLAEVMKNSVSVGVELASIALLVVAGAILLWRQPLSEEEMGEEVSAEEALSKLLQVSEKLASRESGQPVSLNEEEAKWGERMVVVEVVNDQESGPGGEREEEGSYDSVGEDEGKEWIEREAAEPEKSKGLAGSDAELEEMQSFEKSEDFVETGLDDLEETEEAPEPENAEGYAETEFGNLEETEEEPENAEGYVETEFGDLEEAEEIPELEKSGDSAETGLDKPEGAEEEPEPEAAQSEDFAEMETEPEETGEEPEPETVQSEDFAEMETEPEETGEEPEVSQSEDFAEMETEPEETGEEPEVSQSEDFAEIETESEETGEVPELETVQSEDFAEMETESEETGKVSEAGRSESFAEMETGPETDQSEDFVEMEPEPEAAQSEDFAETETEPEETREVPEAAQSEDFAEAETEPGDSEGVAETDIEREEVEEEPEPAQIINLFDTGEELKEEAGEISQAELAEIEAELLETEETQMKEQEEGPRYAQVVDLFDTEEEAEEEQGQEAGEAQEQSEDSSLSEILEEDFPLYELLEEYSDELFQHSQYISALSAAAAAVIGADVELARAGGLYHEVGRIMNEGNYVEEGITLAEEYGFPEELVKVIGQHSIAAEPPESAEAAIVMLSDCIITTAELLEKNGKRDTITDGKLVNKVFRSRITAGSFKNSGLTAEQLIALKDYYTSNAFAL